MTVVEPSELPVVKAPRKEGRGLLEVTETVAKLALFRLWFTKLESAKIPTKIGIERASLVLFFKKGRDINN